MAANKNDKFKKVGRSTATTLSSPGYTISDTSINVASTTNWPTDTGVTFAIDEVDSAGARVNGTYNVFKGVVSSATQISSVEYVGGDTNRDYSAGATTRVYIDIDYSRHNEMIDGILEEHNQDGTHSDMTATSVTTDTVSVDTISEKTSANGVNIDSLKIKDGKLATNNSVVTSNYTDGSVTPPKWTNPYKFSAYVSNGQNVGTSATKVQFNVKEYDTNSNYDHATNYRYTAPVAGFYQFNVAILVNTLGSGTHVAAYLLKNGSTARTLFFISAAAGTASGFSTATQIQLAAGDYVEVSVGTAVAAKALDVSSPSNNVFSGFLVSET